MCPHRPSIRHQQGYAGIDSASMLVGLGTWAATSAGLATAFNYYAKPGPVAHFIGVVACMVAPSVMLKGVELALEAVETYRDRQYYKNAQKQKTTPPNLDTPGLQK